MAKIVYNACYGGFSLSREAVLLAREISGDPKWGGPCIAGDVYSTGQTVPNDFGYIEGVERHDAALVAAVEQLGPAASGSCAKLRIEDLESGARYRIDEYDGFESVVVPDDDQWSIAP